MRSRLAAGAVAMALLGAAACSSTIQGQAVPVTGLTVPSGSAVSTSASAPRTTSRPSTSTRRSSSTASPRTGGGNSSVVDCAFVLSTIDPMIDDVNAYIDAANSDSPTAQAAKRTAVAAARTAADALSQHSFADPAIGAAVVPLAGSTRTLGSTLDASTEGSSINPAKDDFNAKFDVAKTRCGG